MSEHETEPHYGEESQDQHATYGEETTPEKDTTGASDDESDTSTEESPLG